MGRKLVFCFDGTWNKIDADYPTNVARVAQSVSHRDAEGKPQLIYYDEGVGTTRQDRILGGVFGKGLDQNILEAYHFLVLNYEPHDELFVFGFSRGAFTARSFVGLIRNCGIMSRRSLSHIAKAVALYFDRSEAASPRDQNMMQFRLDHCPQLCVPGDRRWRAGNELLKVAEQTQEPLDIKIKFMGIWDTVGALGVPKAFDPLNLSSRYRFHDTRLSKIVEAARHAVSADEQRKTFQPTLWSNLDDLNEETADGSTPYWQLIFPGTHSGVGGGGPIRGLSDLALEWVVKGAQEKGLIFDLDEGSPLYSLEPDCRAQLFNEQAKTNWAIKDRLMGTGLAPRHFPNLNDLDFHESLVQRFATPAVDLADGRDYRPLSLKSFWGRLEALARKLDARIEARVKDAIDDPRRRQMPSSVTPYRIQKGDTLGKIAESQMGIREDWKILFLHNRAIGLLHDPDRIYAGTEIEIPRYS